jgi:hypothetical protein
MTFTPSAFESYVMGYRHNHQRSPNGEIIIVPEKIGMHEWKVKRFRLDSSTFQTRKMCRPSTAWARRPDSAPAVEKFAFRPQSGEVRLTDSSQ